MPRVMQFELILHIDLVFAACVPQALLNICYPLSRVYVGKRVDEPVGVAMRYMLFWGTLIAWKLYFSYKYEVL